MIVVCDASPLIFLAKLNRLPLMAQVLGDEIVVLRCVADEVLAGSTAGSVEWARLNAFLSDVSVVSFTESAYTAGRLSTSDRQTLTYAVSQRAAWLVADERLLRRVAQGEGLMTIGTLGLLAAAVRQGTLTSAEALADVEALVTQHRLRISLALYQRFRTEMSHPRS